MAILLRELARNRKSLMIWTAIMVLLSVFLMTFYPTVLDQGEELDRLMKQYPQELVQAFNMDRLRMADPLGFFGTEAYLFMTLFGSIFSMMLFSGLLSREESEKTTEFLLAKPVNRADVITSKSIAAFLSIVVFNAFFGAANYILLEVYAKGKYDKEIFLYLILGAFLIHVVFGFLGLLLSVFIPKIRLVYSVSIGVVLTSYFLSIASTLTESGEFLKYFSFFKYMDAADIVENAGMTALFLFLIIGLGILFLGLSYLFYMTKDIKN